MLKGPAELSSARLGTCVAPGLPVTSTHFKQWLELFHKTVDENFVGGKAEEAKSRADNIASVFQFKLGLLK